jgi:hypothetical protein
VCFFGKQELSTAYYRFLGVLCIEEINITKAFRGLTKVFQPSLENNIFFLLAICITFLFELLLAFDHIFSNTLISTNIPGGPYYQSGQDYNVLKKG